MRTHRATACLRRGVASHLVHAEVLFDHPGAVVKKGAVISPFSNSPRPVSWHPARRSAARPLALPTCRSTVSPLRAAPRRAAATAPHPHNGGSERGLAEWLWRGKMDYLSLQGSSQYKSSRPCPYPCRVVFTRFVS